MPWADHKPTVEETETVVRTAQARWILREDLMLLIFDAEGKELLGSTGLHRMNWAIPKFEIGYWVNSNHAGNGIITESTAALTLYAFKQIYAARVEIKCDEENKASRKVAEKLGFTQEAILMHDSLKPQTHKPRNTVIYARYNCDGLPEVDATW
jgi:RimJ/RimL family protein N-acetyltransferase